MNKIKAIINVLRRRKTDGINISYSQCGEDLIINYVFGLRGIYQPTYLDIGAFNPVFISNTALFYKKGCRGINVEANPNLIHSFFKHRPKDVNLNVGVGTPGKLDFYILSDATLSSFSKVEVDAIINQGKAKLQEVVQVEILDINELLRRYNNGEPVDFLSLDVEGLDEQILHSLDFEKYAPKVICVEAAEYSPIGAGARRDTMIKYLVSKNYYEYANTNLNAIMIRRDFWFIK